MDGREGIPSDFTERQANFRPTSQTVQSTAFTLCIG